MNKGVVLSVTSPAGTCAVQLQGGPTVTAGYLTPAPGVGQRVFLQDMGAGSWLVLGTQSINFQLPWNLPWGYIASTTTSSNVNVGTTSQNFQTLSFTAVANRRYKASVAGWTWNPGGNTTVEVRLTMNSANIELLSTTTTSPEPITGFNVQAISSAGSQTVSVGYLFVAGTGGSMNCVNTSAVLMVEDVGPAGNPLLQ